MCTGKIERVWVQDEPIIAYKIQTNMEWGRNLGELQMRGGWHEARLQVIAQGGGAGIILQDREMSRGWGDCTKSVGQYLNDEKDNLRIIRYTDVQLSGWHGYRLEKKAWSECECLAEIEMVYKVEFRGLLQESSEGELVASEMRVLEKLPLV